MKDEMMLRWKFGSDQFKISSLRPQICPLMAEKGLTGIMIPLLRNSANISAFWMELP